MAAFYACYIRSAAWLNSRARLEELKLAGHRCRLCNAGNDRGLAVHHRTYRRLGHEQASDLTTLCTACHTEVTAILLRRRYRSRRALPKISDITPPVVRHLIDSTAGRLR